MKQNILALDLGRASLGVAISRSGMFITPLKNIHYKMDDFDDCLSQLKELTVLEKVDTIVIGYPYYPSGDMSEMTENVDKFIPRLNELFPGREAIKVDERNSTVEASQMLHSNNKNSKKQKSIIDSAAAMIILERYLRSIGQM